MFLKNFGRWMGIVFCLFILCSTFQTAFAWDMMPPAEPVKNTADAFDEAWRIEAAQKFREQGLVGTSGVAAAILLAMLVVLAGALFQRMVKRNHMERTAGNIRSGLLLFYTRMWLISRWGFRY